MFHNSVFLVPSAVIRAEKNISCVLGGKKEYCFVLVIFSLKDIQRAKFPRRSWEMANIFGKY